MSLSSILQSSTSGLYAAQTQLGVISDNIANINTPGYARRVADQLVQDGIPGSRIQRTGHGPTDFTATSQESRRVEIDVGG